MSELDRKIAELVMGEPIPDWEWVPGRQSVIGGWTFNPFLPDWEPLPFSSDLEWAMKAWENYRMAFSTKRGFSVELRLSYDPEWDDSWGALTGYLNSPVGHGSSAPEAICKLLLSLVEGEK